MAATQYTLKAVPIWAEQVPTELVDIVEVAGRWGATVNIAPSGITVTLLATVGKATARPGDWLMNQANGDKGCCTNEEFVASFDPVVS